MNVGSDHSASAEPGSGTPPTFRDGDDLCQRGQILYVSSVDLSLGGGPGVNERDFVLALHRAMGKRAHFLIPEPGSPVDDLPLECCTFSKPHRKHHPFRYLLHMLSQARRGVAAVNGLEVDLIVARPDILPLGLLYLSARSSQPLVLKTLGRGEVESLSERGGLLGRILAPTNRALMRRLIRSSLVTDACSHAMIQYLTERLQLERGAFEWVDNGVDVSRFVPTSPEAARAALNLPERGPVLGYVGSRPSERGARHLIEAAPYLTTQFPDLQILIVGDDPSLPQLREIALRLDVANRVHFAGYVPFDKVPQYVNALDVGVSLSDRRTRYAAAELKVRQYLACGKPVVAGPGSNDFLSERSLGSIVSPSDSTAIVSALTHWLGLGPTAKREFGERARTFVESQLSSDAMMAQRFEIWAERLSQLERSA